MVSWNAHIVCHLWPTAHAFSQLIVRATKYMPSAEYLVLQDSTHAYINVLYNEYDRPAWHSNVASMVKVRSILQFVFIREKKDDLQFFLISDARQHKQTELLMSASNDLIKTVKLV